MLVYSPVQRQVQEKCAPVLRVSDVCSPIETGTWGVGVGRGANGQWQPCHGGSRQCTKAKIGQIEPEGMHGLLIQLRNNIDVQQPLISKLARTS